MVISLSTKPIDFNIPNSRLRLLIITLIAIILFFAISFITVLFQINSPLHRQDLQNKFEIIELEYSVSKLSSHSWAYINYLQVGKFILLPSLGTLEDEEAYEQFSTIFPDYQIEQINVSEIIKLGIIFTL